MPEETTTLIEPIDPPETEKDTPPDKTPKKKRRRSSGGSKPTYAQIESALDSIWVIGGGSLMAFDPYCGSVLVTKGPEVTKALIELARVNPAVKRALEGLVTTSAWGGVAVAAAGVALPIMGHHRMIPAGMGAMFGPSADELEAAGIDSDKVYQTLLGLSDEDDGSETDEGTDSPPTVE